MIEEIRELFQTLIAPQLEGCFMNHFVFVILLLVFVIVHVTMLVFAGFWRNVRAMITGYMPHEEEVR